MSIEEENWIQLDIDAQNEADEEYACMDFLIHSKGETWSSLNLDVLPYIDFDAIEKQTNLTFDEDIRKGLKMALAEYICQVRSFGRPLSSERKKALRAVEDACKLLESFLEWDAPGKLSESEYDPMKLYLYDCVKPSVNCFVEEGEGGGLPRLIVKERDLFDDEIGEVKFNGKNVSDYLALCRKEIEEERSWPTGSGRPKNSNIRRCLHWLREFYHEAGGEGRGVIRSADGSFSGPFLTFSKLLLDYTQKPLGLTESPFAETALGALVVNKYKI